MSTLNDCYRVATHWRGKWHAVPHCSFLVLLMKQPLLWVTSADVVSAWEIGCIISGFLGMKFSMCSDVGCVLPHVLHVRLLRQPFDMWFQPKHAKQRFLFLRNDRRSSIDLFRNSKHVSRSCDWLHNLQLICFEATLWLPLLMITMWLQNKSIANYAISRMILTHVLNSWTSQLKTVDHFLRTKISDTPHWIYENIPRCHVADRCLFRSEPTRTHTHRHTHTGGVYRHTISVWSDTRWHREWVAILEPQSPGIVGSALRPPPLRLTVHQRLAINTVETFTPSIDSPFVGT